jgi:dTDP-4-dehydrorhamnose reductase
MYRYSNEGVISWYDFAKQFFELSATSVRVQPLMTIDIRLKQSDSLFCGLKQD